MAASDAQRAAVAGRCCVVCGADKRVDPAHVIPKSLGGCNHPLCVIPACRRCHRAYSTVVLHTCWRSEIAGRLLRAETFPQNRTRARAAMPLGARTCGVAKCQWTLAFAVADLHRLL
jgi:hypothetical protein